MKRFIIVIGIFAAIVATLQFTSCTKQPKKLGNYELIEKDGKLGLQENKRVILEPVYDEITECPELSCVMAKSGEQVTLVVDGLIAFSDEVMSINKTVIDGCHIISTPKGMYWWDSTKKNAEGVFEHIAVEDNVIFFRTQEGWGAQYQNNTVIAPCYYDNIYLVNNGDRSAILVKNATGWLMYDKVVSDSTQLTISKKLQRKLKNFDASKSHGKLEVDWPL